MRKKFNIDKLVLVIILTFLVCIFLMPIFGENLKEFERNRKKRNIDYKFPVTEEDGWYFSEHCRFNVDEWDNLYLRYSGYEEISEFLHFVDIHVDEISKLLGVNKLGNNIITFGLDTEGYGYVDTDNYTIMYSNYYFLNSIKKASITDEVFQIVAGNSTSSGLNEGLNFYVGQQMDTIIRGNRIQQDIICRSKIDMNDRNNVMIQYVGNDGGFTYVDEEGKEYLNTQMYALYIFNRSFVRYLIDEYGLDKLLELYYSDNIASQYNKIYGHSLEYLRDKWIEYVNVKYEEKYGK